MLKNNLLVNKKQFNENNVPADLCHLSIKPRDLTQEEIVKFLYEIPFFATVNKWGDEVILVSNSDLIRNNLNFKLAPFENYNNQIVTEMNNLSKGYGDYGWFNLNYPSN